MPRATRAIVASVLLLLACPGTVRALTDEVIFADLHFNLSHPGPRALGLGGAFVALAADATAATANPAGLYSIDRSQAFVEYRGIDRDPNVVSSASGSVAVDSVTGERNLPFLAVTTASDPETYSGLSFASLAVPVRLGQSEMPLNLFVAWQVLAADESSLSAPGGASTGSRASFESYPNTVHGGVVEAYTVDESVTGTRTMDVDALSAGAALGIHPDFSLGLAVTLARLDIEAHTTSQTIDPLGLVLDPGHPRLPSHPAGDVVSSTLDGEDSDWVYTLGVHWHPDSLYASGRSPWRFGAALQKGARFKTQQTLLLNGTVDQVFTNEIHVPDRYSIGASYAFGERWTFAFEFERIEYSDMLDGFVIGVNTLTSERFAQGSFTTDPSQSVEYTVDDANVPRVGVEYRFPAGDGSRRATLRAGYFQEKDSRIRMESFNSTDPVVNQVFLEAFAGGEDVDHFTAGFGYAAGRYDFGLAGDFSDTGIEAVAGVTIHWGER